MARLRSPHRPSLQRADDGDAAADAGLEADLDALPFGGAEDLVAVVGEQRLVGGDDVLVAGDRFEHEAARRVGAAHELDDDVDGRIVEHGARVGDQDAAGELHAAVALGVDVGDPHQVEADAERVADAGAVALQELDDAGPDRAEADQADADGLLAHVCLQDVRTPLTRPIDPGAQITFVPAWIGSAGLRARLARRAPAAVRRAPSGLVSADGAQTGTEARATVQSGSSRWRKRPRVGNYWPPKRPSGCAAKQVSEPCWHMTT